MKLKLLGITIASSLLIFTGCATTGTSAVSAKDSFAADLKSIRASVPTMNSSELMAWNKAGKEFVLVDIRTGKEVVQGTIDAHEVKKISRGKLEFAGILKNAMPSDKTYVIYCAKGARGALAVQVLQDYGYKNVYNLEGGITAWLKAGYPVVNSLGTFKKVSDLATGLE